jgi:hypothetical protein
VGDQGEDNISVVEGRFGLVPAITWVESGGVEPGVEGEGLEVGKKVCSERGGVAVGRRR